MKLFLSLLFFLSIATAFSQNTDIRGKRIIADNGIFIKDRWLDSVKNNITNLTVNQERTLMTTKAVLELFNSGAAVLEVFQYATNENVVVADSTTVLVLNDAGPNTANRSVTLKSPAAFNGKSLKILNYGSGAYSNVLTTGILGRDGIVFSVLKQPATYTLISTGDVWRILSVSEDVEGGGGSGGGNSSGAIVTWD